MTIGQQLQEARTNLALTQRQLSARSGVSRFTIQGIEQDRFVPSLPNLLKLARVLKAPLWFDESGTDILVVARRKR